MAQPVLNSNSPNPQPAKKPRAHPPSAPSPDDHEGATEDQVDDRGRSGPGPGYDEEPEQVPDSSGIENS